MSKKVDTKTKEKTSDGKNLSDIYVWGQKEPKENVKIDELMNLYHKPQTKAIEKGMTYGVGSDPIVMAQYFVQKYKRKEMMWVAEAPVEGILGDAWFWNWNNWAVRTLHMRVMNFQTSFDYSKVWYGKIIKHGQEFAELMFMEELTELNKMDIDEITQMNKLDWDEMKKEEESRVSDLKSGRPTPSK